MLKADDQYLVLYLQQNPWKAVSEIGKSALYKKNNNINPFNTSDDYSRRQKYALNA